MKTIEKLREQFSFFKGNYLVLIISWILMDFAGELPSIYCSDYGAARREIHSSWTNNASLNSVFSFSSIPRGIFSR